MLESPIVEAISADMNYFTEVCEANRDFEVMLESPIVKADKKIAVINAIFEQFHPLSKSFAELITRNGREAMLPQIAIAFNDLLKAHNGILPITLVSAKPLADSVKKSILAKVQGSVEGKLEVTELIDEALVGGFIVRMGDFQIDASVASQLGQLKQRLTR